MKVAIVKLSALGDIVHAMVALQFIKSEIKDIEIDWIVEERYADVLKDNPDINHILTLNLKSLKQNKANLFLELKKIRFYAANYYDLVIDAQGLIKSAVTARLLNKKTAGFDRNSIREKLASFFYQQKIACAYDVNTIDRNATVIATPLGLKIAEQQIINKQPFLFFHQKALHLEQYTEKDQANVIFIIGSTWESRNYPKEKYLKVIEGLKANSLLAWGNAKEKAFADWIQQRSNYARVLPKLDMNDLKAIISTMDLLIGNDTGPTHIAWGLNVPSITLFGPTPVSRVYQTDINKVLKSPSIVNPFKLNKEDFSISEIKENDIIELAKTMLIEVKSESVKQ
jgi:heptosyltransferase-1